MFSTNPFAELSAFIPSFVMQVYVIAMVALVVGSTLFDIVHKGSAKYFFANWRKSKEKSARPVGGAQMVSLAVQTAASEVLTSSEFCNPQRRIAHLLGMYGFVIYAITTAIMVFQYAHPGIATPEPLPQLWHVGAGMVCIGGYWFWFFIRVDVASEGQSPFRVMQADIFVLSLLVGVTLALIWSYLQFSDSLLSNIFLGLYLIATTVLFGSVPWSKFSHMFFKPAAAFEKRVSNANGSRNNLPPPADKPEIYGSGRQQPHHY